MKNLGVDFRRGNMSRHVSLNQPAGPLPFYFGLNLPRAKAPSAKPRSRRAIS